MSVPLIQTAFATGEVSPSLFGHVDLAKMHSAASTMRNMIVNYRGGAYSRAGTKFCGFSKQTGRAFPPRMVTFQFSINQGLALEFGNEYMRVISNGAFVTENPIAVTAISQANPGVISMVPLSKLVAVGVDGSTVPTSSYAPGDTVTLAGGTFTSAAALLINLTTIASGLTSAFGSGYRIGDTINLAGGTQSSQPSGTVTGVTVISATLVSAGTGGSIGPGTVSGTTGTGVKFQAAVTIGGGNITAINSITMGGNYTVEPTNLAHEPVTGAGLSGAVFALTLGVTNINLTSPGVFSANPGSTMTQASTSGAGTGYQFGSVILGPFSLSISNPGLYTVDPISPVSQSSTSGIGANATFDVDFAGVPYFNTGDWVFLSNIGGMTELNGNTYTVVQVDPSDYQLFDVYGDAIDTSGFPAYTGGGTVSRIFTLTTPYSEQDLPYLKFTQSADVMSLCLVNQQTGAEYQAMDLSRISDEDWVFSPVVAGPTVSAPTDATGTASAAGTVFYQYVATAVSPVDGTESQPSVIANVPNGVDIAATAGSITLQIDPVSGVNQYNWYKALPGYGVAIPVGSLFGFAGSSYGTQFIDSNIVPDFTQVPPSHQDPFARGQIIGCPIINPGTGYTLACTATITTSTGSGASLETVTDTTGALVGIIIQDAGSNYQPSDTLTITGNGTGAVAGLTVGALSGTYPAVPSYYQERRVYGYTLNNPDTYFMSQPGSFTNFDSRIPSIASDAIIGSPWSVQVNGIQFMVPMPGGLVVLTGLAAWQVTGAGGSASNPQPITPSSQQAQPQAYNGCSATVPPIKIDNEILYVQAKGSIYRDLSYSFFTNIYTGSDVTQYSSHLFVGYTIREHAWCEEPFKVLWAVRNDGILLSMTFNKPQDVTGWAKHDTNGLFQSVCSVTEPPVDALYAAVQRFPGSRSAYMIERMDDRIWSQVEDTWCVDCGLALQQFEPDATIQASSSTGLGSLTGVTDLVPGAGYSASTTATVVDDNGAGPGSGAVVALTIVGGAITAINFSSQGSGYTFPKIVIIDPTNAGSGASAIPVLNNTAQFTTSAAVFTTGSVGVVIRMGGGIALITQFIDSENVMANILSPIVDLLPNSGPPSIVLFQTFQNWSLSGPVSSIGGLQHLVGATVTGLADGNVISPRVVSATGTIPLDTPASAVTVGLAFMPQLQSTYLDAGEPTIQGQRKKVAAASARIEASRGLMVGANQPDGSVLSPMQIAPTWSQLDVAPDLARRPYNALATPLYTGDVRVPLKGGYNKHGQVAIQQNNPLPMQVLAFIPELFAGDSPETQAKPRQRAQGQ